MSTTYIVRWHDEDRKPGSLSTPSLERVRDTVLDLLRRELEFSVIVRRPGGRR